jgi:hypothetical protein
MRVDMSVFIRLFNVHTHTHTHTYIYIYIITSGELFQSLGSDFSRLKSMWGHVSALKVFNAWRKDFRL